MEEVSPVSGIKEYIISCRNAGQPDSAIIKNLKQVNWPDDVIAAAINDANSVIAAVPEPEPAKETPSQDSKKNSKSPGERAPLNTEDLFTQPEMIKTKAEIPKQEEKPKKTFSFFSLLSLLFSPIPFVGLGVGMAAFDSARKNNQTGGFFALITILINFAVILFIGYVFYQIFSLDSGQLTGFSKFISEQFNLV